MKVNNERETKRLRLPDTPRVAIVGRLEDKQEITSITRLLGGAMVDKPPAHVVVVGGRPSKRKLETLRAGNPELVELSESEFREVDMQPELLVALRAEGTRPWQWFYYRRRQQEARDADLEGATFDYGRTDVSGSRLVGAKILGGELQAKGCDFSGASFSGTVQGVFEGGVFDGADFSAAEFGICRFVGVDFTRAKLAGARWDRGTFEDCRFDGHRAEHPLQGTFTRCSFVGFEGQIDSDEVVDCDLRQAKLGASFLAGADLASCKLEGADLSSANTIGCTPLPAPADAGVELPDDFSSTLRCSVDRTDVILRVSQYRGELIGQVLRGDGSYPRHLVWQLAEGLAMLRSWNARPQWDTQQPERDRRVWASLLGASAPAPAAAAEQAEPLDDSELVAMLAEDPQDDGRWSVFCDALLEHGDPRGPILRRLLDDDPRTEHDWGSQWPQQRYSDLSLEWWRLFIRTVTIRRASVRRKDLLELVEHPACRLVQRVRFDRNAKSGNELLLASLRPSSVRFRFEWMPTVRKLKAPAPHVRTLMIPELGDGGPLIAERFPQLKLLTVVRPEQLVGLDVPALVIANPMKRPPRRVRARHVGLSSLSTMTQGMFDSFDAMRDHAIGHALKVKGLEALYVAWEPTAEQRRVVEAADVKLVVDMRHQIDLAAME
jgi:uncharacterized protein YjbI with pentapeptide repeats